MLKTESAQPKPAAAPSASSMASVSRPPALAPAATPSADKRSKLDNDAVMAAQYAAFDLPPVAPDPATKKAAQQGLIPSRW